MSSHSRRNAGAQPRSAELPPSPSQKRAQRVGGKRTGQPRRPVQTLSDEHWAPACKSCRGHRGVRQCCSRHHEGHPRVLCCGHWCLPVGGGGGRNRNWALCPSEGRCACRLPRPGEGAGVQQGREQRCCHAGARRSSSAAMGRRQRRAPHSRRTSFRRAATHRRARGGIGQATGRL